MPLIDHAHLLTYLTHPICWGSNRDLPMLDKRDYQVYLHSTSTLCAVYWVLHSSCPPTDQAVAVPWCRFLLPRAITSFHGHFLFLCIHSRHTQQCCESSTSTTLEFKHRFIRLKKEKQFLQLQQLFCYSFNDSDHHGINSSCHDYDSTSSLFLPFFLFSFLLSLFAHLYGISATRRHLRHFFGSLYLPFVFGWHHECATASALWWFCQTPHPGLQGD